MTVAELITFLQTCEPDAVISVPGGYIEEYNDLEASQIQVQWLRKVSQLGFNTREEAERGRGGKRHEVYQVVSF